MLFNSYLLQRLREERVKDAMRKAEQARLIRVAKGARAADQVTWRDLLTTIRELGLLLLSAHHIEPDVEGV